MELTVRKMLLEDAHYINLLSHQLGYPVAVEQTEELIGEVLSTSGHVAYVAVYNGEVVAWIHAAKAIGLETKPFIEIRGLVVNEKLRKKGIGEKLVNRIREWCIEKDIHDLRVRSNIKRKESHPFYLALGFSETKQQKVYQLKVCH